MEASAFTIKASQFEGPLDLLLELIEKRKFFVNDVSLAAVTDDYITFLQENKVPAESVAGFVSVAATLILIKARSLLPNIELTKEEEQDIQALEFRLQLYKLITDVAPKLSTMYGKKTIFTPRRKIQMQVFAPDPKLVVETFPEIIAEILGRVPKEKPKAPEAVVYKTISIREVLDSLTERIARAAQTTFSSVVVTSPDQDTKSQKVYTIVSFLGMLELVRRGHIHADQTDLFDEITIEKVQEVGEPLQIDYE